jgi:N-acetylmuramoyl-L-alanine amidase
LPVLSGDLKREAELKKTYAEEQRLLPTADALYEEADAQTTASGRFNAFVSGVIFYPEDSRFQEGVNTSARGLMDYAIRMHGQGNYSVASSRYQAILDAPAVDALLLREAELRKGYADKGQKIPTANQLYNEINNSTTASGQFTSSVNGYLLYPNDSRFKKAVEDSNKILLNWATTQHKNGNINTAIDRYERILNAPVIDSVTKKLTEVQLNYANRGRSLPDTIMIGTVQTSSSLNVRSAPGTGNSVIIGTLANGSVIEVQSIESNGWLKINYGGVTAYVSGSYVNIDYFPEQANNGPLAGKVIVLDAGHGGSDPGAVAGGMQEKDLVLDVSLRAQKLLEEAGATVIMTRSTDVFIPLDQRSAIANSSNADVFLSVHANAFNGSANGTETYWNSTYQSSNSQRLANSIQSATLSKLGLNNRGVKTGNFAVIRSTRIPSALLELGFMDHAGDAAVLRQSSSRQRAAEAIRDGMINYFN